MYFYLKKDYGATPFPELDSAYLYLNFNYQNISSGILPYISYFLFGFF